MKIKVSCDGKVVNIPIVDGVRYAGHVVAASGRSEVIFTLYLTLSHSRYLDVV